MGIKRKILSFGEFKGKKKTLEKAEKHPIKESIELNEGIFGEIDIIGQESETKEEFKKNVKDLLKKRAADPKVANDDNYIEELASTYFDEEGNKK